MKTQKKRVVAYARVSTNKQDQKNSFENQQSYFLRELSKNEEYILVSLPTNTSGIYADKGTSGTKLVRPQFTQMLLDAGLKQVVSEETGKVTDKYEIIDKPKFDIIFVKDTTRFARNVSADDLLKTLRQNNVIVHFLDIQRTTEKLEDITAIQIFLSLGESESSRKSASVKMGYKEGARQGNIYMGGKIIGYDYIKKDIKRPYKTNILKINEKEAELVRLVYDLYTEEGLGHQQICNELAKRGYMNSKGNKYTRSTISRMLENEKYIGVNTAGKYTYGDLFNKKQVQIDYNDEVRVKARQETQRLADEGIVQRIEPIISKEQFEKAQQIRERNRKKYNNDCSYHGMTDYARKIKCGRCGAWYTAQSRKYNIGKDMQTRYYACAHRFAYDEMNNIPKCNNPSIREDKLDEILNSSMYYEYRLNVVQEILGAGEQCTHTRKKAISENNDKEVLELQDKIADLTSARDKLIPLFAKGIYSEEQLESTTKEYNKQIDSLTLKANQLSKGNDEIRADIETIKELMQSAEEEEKEILQALKTKKYPKRTRKELLKDIDYISIDIFGEPSFVFKSLNEIEKAISYIEQITATYTTEQIDSTPKKTFEEVLEQAEKSGMNIIKH